MCTVQAGFDEYSIHRVDMHRNNNNGVRDDLDVRHDDALVCAFDVILRDLAGIYGMSKRY
jgi:hypothetical protein